MSTSYKAFSIIWKTYLHLSKIRAAQNYDIPDKTTFKKFSTLSKYFDEINTVSPPTNLIIYNGERERSFARLKTVSENLAKLKDENDVKKNISLSFERIKLWPGYSRVFFKTIYVVLAALPWILKHNLFLKDSAWLIFIAYGYWFKKKNIVKVFFFTENSRIAELQRLAAILLGIRQYVFLHGVTSESYGIYYEVLEGLLKQRSCEYYYINMHPKLPQPTACAHRSVKVRDKEVFFWNETAWLPYEDNPIDVVIIGGNHLGDNYEKSEYFKNELTTIDFCKQQNLSCVYCPHPSIWQQIVHFLPDETDIMPSYEVMLRAKVFVGHFSTTLFMAKLFNRHVFLYKDALPHIPPELIDLFNNVDDHIYHQNKLTMVISDMIKDDYFHLNMDDGALNLENL